MTINMAASSTGASLFTGTVTSQAKSAQDTSSSAKSNAASNTTSASASASSELTEAEKEYDVDGDGVLSITEKAAMQEAQAKEAEKKPQGPPPKPAGGFSPQAASVEISQQGMELYNQSKTTGAQTA